MTVAILLISFIFFSNTEDKRLLVVDSNHYSDKVAS